ncbi:MAG: T9SS type A sorting domain-containing protein, partial [Bacteroidales bacterium]|nr:T9SS type A sorting domain-containing protein [Bacteroidales bacterium]
NLETTSQSFYFDTDVAIFAPGIADLHARGIKYHMFLELYWLEVGVDTLMETDPLITDRHFGVVYKLDGTKDTTQRSINRPSYRDFFIRCIKRGIDAGADGIQIDMAGEQFVKSFDPDDVAAFVTYMKANYPSSVWTSQGVGNIDTLDYREWIHDIKGFTTFPETFDIGGGDPPLAIYWILFKFHQIQDSWKIISDSAKNYAQSKYGRDFTITGNNAYFGNFGQHGILTMGDVCGEYFGFNQNYPLREATTFIHKAVQGYGKRHLIWSVPWNDAGCNCKNYEFDLHMVAESFACGGLAQFAGEAIEHDEYAKYFYMIQRQRDLFDKMNPYGEVGVILAMPSTVCAWGTADPHFGAQALMQDIGRSFNVEIGGSNMGWPDSLKLSQLTKYKMVVLHEAIRLTNNQVSVLLSYANQGGKLLVFGTGFSPGWSGALDEWGNTRTNNTWKNLVYGSTKISNYGSGKVIYIKEDTDAPDGYCKTYYRYNNTNDASKQTIANNIRKKVRRYVDSVLTKETIRFTLPQRVMFFRSQDTVTKTMLYHLVNGDVDTTTRLHPTLTNKIVKFDLMDQLSAKDSVAVTMFNPDNPEGILLGNLKVDSGRVAVTVPELFIWDMFKITEKSGPAAIAVKNLNVTNAVATYRLKSNAKPNFTWHIESGTQQKYQLQIWNNSLFYGTPTFESGWVASTDTFFNYTNTNLTVGMSYISRVRIKNSSNDTSDWTMKTFHINQNPPAPTHLYGISAVIETRANVPFWWTEAVDPEGDSLKYFWQLCTDSVYNNFSDSTNLDFLYSSPYSWHRPELGQDGVFDTLKATINVDNFGFWWKVFSFDGLDTSLRSRWARFTWDHINDPPKIFNLLNPPNASNIRTTGQLVSFNWENNGDMDPNTPGLKPFDLLISESSDFLTGVQTFNCNPARNFNPFPIQAHKIVYWKVKAYDQTDQTRWSNQIWKLYIDNNINTAPTKPVLVNPCNGCSADTSTFLNWQFSTDAQSDSILYRLEVDSMPGITGPFMVVDNIFDITVPNVEKKLKSQPNFNLMKNGRTYYWRVRANDMYNNGISQWSNVWNFIFNLSTNISEQQNNNLSIVYPNPVGNISVLDLSKINKTGLTLIIYNSLGQEVVKTNSFKNNKFYIVNKNYSSGIYTYNIYCKDGYVGNGKFVVK